MKRISTVCAALLMLALARHAVAIARPQAAIPPRTAAPACTFPDTTLFVGPIRVADLADGLSSDGRGAYLPGRDGVIGLGPISSGVSGSASLTIFQAPDAVGRRPRGLVVNLDHPAPGGGGKPLGIVTDTTGGGMGLMAQWSVVDGAFRNLHAMRVGQAVKAAMTSVTFYIAGRRYLLQMGPLPNGHCHNGGVTLVTGKGTTPTTIRRTAAAAWSVDLPAGGVARLFDVTDGTHHAVDRGLYRFRLHYDIGG